MLEQLTVDTIQAAILKWAPEESLVRRVYLFGSRARNEHQPGSDVDLTVTYTLDPIFLRQSIDGRESAHFFMTEHRDRWQETLGSSFSVPVHVELYGPTDVCLRRYLRRSRILLYRQGSL